MNTAASLIIGLPRYLEAMLSVEFSIQLLVTDLHLLRRNHDEEHSRPLITLIHPFVDCSALNDHIARTQLYSLAVIKDERDGAFRNDAVVD